MFTEHTLRRLATKMVFDRGHALWQDGAVRQLAQPASTRFTARVRGSERYRTAVDLARGEAEFSCNCPYEFEGICKHAVARGLAVLATHGPRLGTAAAPAGGADLAAAGARAWAARPPAEHLAFLQSALARHPDLARQFVTYGAAPAAPLRPPTRSKTWPSA